MSHTRNGQTRLTAEERRAQILQACAESPKTVEELAPLVQCSDGLVRFYLKQLPQLTITQRPQPPQRSVLQYSSAPAEAP